MKMSDLDVQCCGLLVADLIARPVDIMPDYNDRPSVIADLKWHMGGCAANTAVSLARLGARVGVIGAVGNDDAGGFVLRKLSEAGVEVSAVKRFDLPTSQTMVIVNSGGKRCFINDPRINRSLKVDDIPDSIIKRAKAFHIAGYYFIDGLIGEDGTPCAELLMVARTNGIYTSVDTVSDPRGRWMERIESCLPHIDLITANLHEGRLLTGRLKPQEIAKVLFEKGVGKAVVKMGEKGCYVEGKNEGFSCPAYDVSMVDDTGAGDAFCAAWIYGVLQGWDVKKIAEFASAAGALCVTRVGATEAITGIDKVWELMEG